MRPARLHRGRLGALVVAALLVGCNKKLHLPVVVNQRPEVSLTQAPVSSTKPYFYSYELRWTGFDPDGSIREYRLAVDPPVPPATDTAWVVTTENRRTFTFNSNDPDSLGTDANPGGYHTIVLKAIDNLGLASEPVTRSFFSYTVAPDVKILHPEPNKLFYPVLPPSVTFTWTGFDPDGVKSRKPVQYKFHLFKDGTEGFSIQQPGAFFDSLRRAYPPNFPKWDSTYSDTTVQIQNLTPGSAYIFAVTCFDEAGAYDPSWSLDRNLLKFYCDFPIVYGPTITMFNDFFRYTYVSPGYLNDPRRYVFLEVPVNRPLTIHWSADPGENSTMKSYRWSMDIDRLDDETPRSGPNDVRHWSFPALSTTSATVGPFANGDLAHTFFLEAEDNNGLKSLGIVSLTIVQPNFQHDLLFVDDTRLTVDEVVAGTDSIRPSYGTKWPAAAELDTFFFARGGVRWRYYAPGTLSPPGIFNGYHYDTLGTATLVNPIVALSTLARYRHVVWYVDQAAQFGTHPPGLRQMSASGQQQTLATYVELGGRVWLMGGGGAYNSLIAKNVTTNDVGGGNIFSFAAGELVPGGMMYDLAHWQSEITSLTAQSAVRAPRVVAGWPGAPDYSGLPPALTRRTAATDPLWPFRTSTQFYTTTCEGEYLSKPNLTVEDLNPDPDAVLFGPGLDTLYTTTSGLPLMTLYRGRENAPFVFSGFPLWFFSRAQAIQLGDWVLQNVWHLPRDPLWRGLRAAPASSAPPVRASGPGPSARAPGR
jgi:hypothetical protein